ncbi:hypothetical protein ADL22_21240 [Streptomyces sp. NRRL F-4489]|uniref:hypothetical protein n=1 Tax=Streptomyces sp. NRRL F-4489 TaxID=1609095 RepID=UPI0007478B83|nr:hypothetical protein [Streptomyces sp. NRRL F-4489]KUL37487.1 hypothetical protein ADL22_21240 [Streptomyces sp. NRRL F-4489]
MAAPDHGPAFLRTLERAEERLAAVRALRARLRRIHRLQAAAAAVALLAPAVPLAGAGGPGGGRDVWIAVALLTTAAALAVLLGLWSACARPSRRRLAAQERAMLADVNRLRELFAHVARREKWDASRTRSVRERLSRFPIEEGSL